MPDPISVAIDELVMNPVPVSGNTIQLVFNTHESGILTISIHNLSGGSVITPIQLFVEKGIVNEKITLPYNLPGGAYFISLNLNGEMKTAEIIIE